MRYLDREGRNLSIEHWMLLYRDLSYSLLRFDRNSLSEVQVTTTWIGVWAELEPKPLTFLVQKKVLAEPKKTEQGGEAAVDENGARVFRTSEWWFGDELAALAFHAKLVKQYL
jgi:hypothetical protein